MGTAVAQPKAPDKTNRKVRFEADGNGLVLIVEPQDFRINGQGKIIPIQGTGKRIEFKPKDRRSQFFETRDPDEIEWLRNHDLFDRRAFVEVPIAKPPSAPVIAHIAELGVDHDIDALVKLHSEEEGGWEREDVLEACEQTIARIEAAQARQSTPPAPPAPPAGQ